MSRDEAMAMSAQDLRDELAQQVEMAGGQVAWGRLRGVAVSQVCETLSGRREASESIINAMGFLRVVRYVPLRGKRNV
jgi:hypothetical protein